MGIKADDIGVDDSLPGPLGAAPVDAAPLFSPETSELRTAQFIPP